MDIPRFTKEVKEYMEKYYKAMLKFFSKNPSYNSFVHFAAGIGTGILITYPMAKEHPVRWAVAFLVLSLAGHVWAGVAKK